jgi:hypothetical protein
VHVLIDDECVPAQAGGYRNALAVTPSDTQDFAAVPSQALYVGYPGDLTVRTAGGQQVTLPELKPGWYGISVRRVMATGTTAQQIVAWW